MDDNAAPYDQNKSLHVCKSTNLLNDVSSEIIEPVYNLDNNAVKDKFRLHLYLVIQSKLENIDIFDKSSNSMIV